MGSRIEEKYKSIYKDFHFERAELFKVISENYKITSVLYPGCNIHITPSFYFQHVIYVDMADNAASFFAEKDQVINLIEKNKSYKPSPYIQFIHQDFTKPLPVRDGSFNLIISLFAGGIADSCSRYLKSGGFLLTNNHQNDAIAALDNHTYIPAAIIAKKKRNYTIVKANKEDILSSIRKSTDKLLNNNPSGGLQYKENETFYLFQKMKD